MPVGGCCADGLASSGILEVGRLQGQWVYGWDQQVRFYESTYSKPLKQRRPQVVWRGRYDQARDKLR